jgi:hypothetical protein
MYSVFMRANINNTNEERESFDASFFVGGGERSFFFWMDFAMHGANKKFTKASFAKKRSQSPKRGWRLFGNLFFRARPTGG